MAFHEWSAPVVTAIMDNDAESFSALLRTNVDILAPARAVRGDISLLRLAAQEGRVSMVRELLAVGRARRVEWSRECCEALTCAASFGHLPVVDLLLTEGVSVNYQSPGLNGGTALYDAAGNGHVNVVVRLLQVNADVALMLHGVRPSEQCVLLLSVFKVHVCLDPPDTFTRGVRCGMRRSGNAPLGVWGISDVQKRQGAECVGCRTRNRQGGCVQNPLGPSE
jgi:hypothetical protein